MAVLQLARAGVVEGGRFSPTRIVAVLGGLSTLGLLSYPLPTAWLGLFGLLGLALARWRLRAAPVPSSSFTIPIGLYLVGGVIGLMVAIHPDGAAMRFFGLVAAIGGFALVLELVRSGESARIVAWIALLVVLVCTPILLLVVYEFTLVAVLPEPVPSWMASLDPVRNVVLNSDEVLLRFRLRRSGLGAIAAFGIALALGPLLAGSSRRTRVLAASAIALLLPFLVAADNRGSLLAVALAGLVVVSLRYWWMVSGVFVVIGAVVAVLTGLVPLPTFEWLVAFRPDRADTVANLLYRTALWNDVLFLLGDYRFTGVGLGGRSVRETYQTYFLPVEPPFSHAHNILLQSYLEQGPLGLAGVLLLGIGTCVLAIRVVRRAQGTAERSAAISASAAALALFLAGQTDIVPMTTVGMVIWFGTLGLLVALDRMVAPAHVRVGSSGTAPIVSSRLAALGSAVGSAALVLVVALALPRSTLASTPDAPAAGSPLHLIAAQIYLNLGSVDLGKVTMGINRPREEREQRLEEAAWYLQRAHDLAPGDLGIDRQRAGVATAQSRESAARRILADAENRASPSDRAFRFQLGRLYRDAGDVERGVAVWSALGERRQLAQWGDRLSRRGSWKSAALVHMAVVQLAPNDASAYPDLTEALRRQEGSDAARAAMLRLAAEHPGTPWPLLEIGDLYARDGDREHARQWYEKAAALAPDQTSVRQRLAGG